MLRTPLDSISFLYAGSPLIWEEKECLPVGLSYIHQMRIVCISILDSCVPLADQIRLPQEIKAIQVELKSFHQKNKCQESG